MHIFICKLQGINCIRVNLSEELEEDEFIYLDKQDLKVIPFCSDDLNVLSNYVDEEKIETIQVCSNLADRKDSDLRFLDGIKNCSQIKNIDIFVDYKENEPLYRFKGLETLRLCCFENSHKPLNLALFPKLKKIEINGSIDITGLDKSSITEMMIYENRRIIINTENKTLETLKVIHSKPFNLSQLKFVPNIKKLVLTQLNVKSLSGLEYLPKLESIEINYCSNLIDVSAIEKSTKLKRAFFENTKKISNFTPLTKLKKLKSLTLLKCGEVKSLSFLNEMPALEDFVFTGTNVVDGDLTPCLRLKSAWSSSGKKHYNINVKDLPQRNN